MLPTVALQHAVLLCDMLYYCRNLLYWFVMMLRERIFELLGAACAADTAGDGANARTGRGSFVIEPKRWYDLTRDGGMATTAQHGDLYTSDPLILSQAQSFIRFMGALLPASLHVPVVHRPHAP